MNEATAKTPPEQILYADVLFYGAWSAIALMIVTYVLYVFGIMDPYIPLEQVPHYWRMPVNEYLHTAQVPRGWGWVVLLGKGDFLNFLGIVLLAAMTVIAFLTLIPAYLKQKDRTLLMIVIIEISVLALAASGILGTGGH